VLIHSAVVESSLSSLMIDGTATFTIVASTMIMETPKLSIARPSQRPRPSVCMAPPTAVAESVTGVDSPIVRLGFGAGPRAPFLAPTTLRMRAGGGFTQFRTNGAAPSPADGSTAHRQPHHLGREILG
jgi:hypothetical protein